ncbi:MAG: flagellar basal body P-ring formation protein FlgA [Gammaproteobacteria bacterium]|nr:flagellar basal body P-ring formation protein FlgA [Gammaproteobacteria bacterium]
MFKIIVLVLSVSLVCVTHIVKASDAHPLEDIRDTASKFVGASLARKEQDIVIKAGKLDSRLRLPACLHALEASMPFSSQISHNTVVAIRCEGEQPWSIHVPVNVQIFRNILVTTRPLARNSPLTTTDITMKRIDISQLAGGYITNRDAALGQLTTRPMQMGQPLMLNALKAATIIRRGQTITMLAKNSSFEVRSSGESLMDGAVGDRIKVRNRRSKRVVEGIIAKNGTVFVN